MQEARNEKRIAMLKEMDVFAGLREAELAALLDDLRLREYQRDDLLFRQGDESRQVYFVLKGKIRVYKISPSGSETSIDIFLAHDVLGELAALDNQPRSATAKAITSVSLLSMAQEHFLHHMETMPGLALGLAKVLSHKLRWTAAYAESIAQFDAAGRLLHIILLNNERYGEVMDAGESSGDRATLEDTGLEPKRKTQTGARAAKGIQRFTVNMGLNQTDLASMIGARREWVNRILSDWRRRGLLEFDNGVITILDLQRVIEERDSRLEANHMSDDW